MSFRRSLTACALLLAGPALAQQPPQAAAPPPPVMSPEASAALAALVKQPGWQGATTVAAKSQYAQIPGNCAAAAYRPTGDLTVYQAPTFSAAQTPVAGTWSEKVEVTGCGAPRMLNVLTMARTDGDPSRIPLMPGSTRADPVTQRSALQYAQAIAAHASPPNCRGQSFTDTQFDGYTGLPDPGVRDGRSPRAWRENWILYACGATYRIPLEFRPNAQGTALVGGNPVKVGGEFVPDVAAPGAPAPAPAAPAKPRR